MDPSRLNLQVGKHAEKREVWVTGNRAVKDSANIPDGRPPTLGIPAPNLGQHSLTGNTTPDHRRWMTRDALFAGCSKTLPSTPMLNTAHDNTIPHAAASVFSYRAAGHNAIPSIRPLSNLHTGYAQVPINILVFNRRSTGASHTRAPLPLSRNILLAPASPMGSSHLHCGASVQLPPNHFLSPERASNTVASDMTYTHLAPSTPDKCWPVNAPVYFQQSSLITGTSRAQGEMEPSRLQQSQAKVVENSSDTPPAPITPAKAEGAERRCSQEMVGKGSAEDNMQKYQRSRKRSKRQINENDDPAYSTAIAMSKERTLTELEMQISGEQVEAYKNDKETHNRKPKSQRKKHRPKVIREVKPAKNPNPAVTTPKVKRTYVRKKRSLSALENPSEPAGDKSSSSGGMTAESSSSSVRRKLHFECEEQAVSREQPPITNRQKHNEEKLYTQGPTGSATESTVQVGQGLQVEMENLPEGFVFDLKSSLNRMLDEYMCLPEATPEAPSSASGCIGRAVLTENSRELANQDNLNSTNNLDTTRHSEFRTEENRRMILVEDNKNDRKSDPSNVHGLQIYCSASSLSEIKSANSQITQAWQAEQWNLEQHKSRKFTSAGPRGSMILKAAAEMLAFCQAGGIKKKRSIRARRLTIVPIKDIENNSSQASCKSSSSCMEALCESAHVKFFTKKRSQKAKVHSHSSADPSMEYKHKVSTGSIFSSSSAGLSASQGNSERTILPWTTIGYIPDDKSSSFDIYQQLPQRSLPRTSMVYMDSLRSVVWKLKNLHLNSKQLNSTPAVSFKKTTEPQNALVPYGGRVVVPYEKPWHMVKKQRPRAKVNLDSETTRVWNLLMGKEANPVEGTDAEKERWWKQEREVFQGRANSFVARMRLVQGDRHFSPWKGSVVDSVVGVFLTQNVADHLSSSAFMALAATFPPRSTNGSRKDDIDSKESEEIMSTNPEQDEESILNFFDSSVRLDLEVNCEDVSAIYEKIHTSPKDKSRANKLFNPNNYSPCKEAAPTGSLHEHQETGIALGAQRYALNFPRGLAASANSPQEIQFQEEVASSQSAVTSELQLRLHLSSGTDYTPGNFVGGLDISASQEFRNNSGGGISSAGNNSEIDRLASQRIGRAARTEVHQPEGATTSMIHSDTSNFDYPQPDERNESYFSSTSPNTSSGSASVNMKNTTLHKSNPHFMPLKAYATQSRGNKILDGTFNLSEYSTEPPVKLYEETRADFEGPDLQEHISCSATGGMIEEKATKTDECSIKSATSSRNIAPETAAYTSKPKNTRSASKNIESFDWDSLRREACCSGSMNESRRRDSVDWEAARCADVKKISDAIRERGMNNVLAERIQNFLNRLVRDHGSIDLEWLRDIPPDRAKDYLLSIRGLGLKSVECVRLLTLHHLAFPVDTNVGRICVRLGWVPLQPLPESLQLHLLELYPVLESIQKYLWPRLCKLDQRTLYELHYQMITFGKVFCTKNKPNCNACPMRSECRHFASAFASARLALPAPEEKSLVNSNQFAFRDGPFHSFNSTLCPQLEGSKHSRDAFGNNSEPIIEEPASPREEECAGTSQNEIEDFYNDPDEIPTIKLNMEAFAQNLEDCIKQSNKELQSEDIAKALVAISPEAASIPVPKLKNVNRLRTEHYVYELPDRHPLVQMLELDLREPDDPSPYLLIVWMPDERTEMSNPPKPCCNSQIEGNLCLCHACVSEQENQSKYVRGTILVPCRTAMRGSFPLNGTYFQVNEVFADHNSSYNPIIVPREQLWNLQRRMVYFGTSVPTIFRGLSTEEIQHCFWRGFVCVRGFDMAARSPKPLCPYLHLAASKLPRNRRTAGQK